VPPVVAEVVAPPPAAEPPAAVKTEPPAEVVVPAVVPPVVAEVVAPPPAAEPPPVVAVPPPAVVATEPPAVVPPVAEPPPAAKTEPPAETVVPAVVAEPPAAVVPPAVVEPEPPPAAAKKADKVVEEVDEELKRLIDGELKKGVTPAKAVEPPPERTVAEVPAVPPPPSDDRAAKVATDMENEQVMRLRAMAQHAKEILRDANTDLDVGRYKDAITKFELAVRSLARPEDFKDRQAARRGLAESHYRHSIYLEKQDDLKASQQAAKNAMDAGHPRGEARFLYVKNLIEHPKEKPPEPEPVRWRQKSYRDKQERVAEYMRRGRERMLAGEYDEASKYFQNILRPEMDPQNTEAIRLLRKCSMSTYDRATMEVDATRETMMSDVRKTWNPRSYAVVEEKKREVDVAQIRQKSEFDTIRNRIMQKLERIEIPEIEFRLANINDVVEFLRQESVQHDKMETDPARKGVNIILNLQAGGGVQAAPAGAATVDPFADAAGARTATAGGGDVPPITFSARFITLLEALKIVTSVANLKWRIEGRAVMIVPINAPDGQIIIRMYDVLPSVEEKLTTIGSSFATAGGGGGGGGVLGAGGARTLEPTGTGSQELDWKQALKEMGVPWPDGSSIRYVRAMGKLVVANTENNLAEFEKILAELNVVPYQIEIEARFVEVSRGDINSLGIEWLLTDDWELATHKDDAALPMAARRRLMMSSNSGAGGFTKGNRYLSQEGVATAVADDILTISSVLTNPELSFVLHALEQRGYADLLSAPKVTTQAGQEATIKVVTEYIYPTDFEVTPVTGTATTTGASTIRGGVVEPSNFETREVGVILSVLPDVSPEGRMINLTMTPEVVSEPEWRDYGSVFTDDEGNETRLRMEQPFFHTRSISTSISIYNGATVVMGGMINENRRDVEDKIPLLGDIPIIGRLFRSKHERSDKRNLLIFVTAKLVDPAGRVLEKTGEGISERLAGATVAADSGSSSSSPAP
jgi:general secretion pathway protein D